MVFPLPKQLAEKRFIFFTCGAGLLLCFGLAFLHFLCFLLTLLADFLGLFLRLALFRLLCSLLALLAGLLGFFLRLDLTLFYFCRGFLLAFLTGVSQSADEHYNYSNH